jgi:predicted nucleic acid-binding protein
MTDVPDPDSVFVDTSYVTSLVNTRDQWHETALRWERRLAVERRRLVATEFILIEIADALARVRFRAHALKIIETLRSSALVEIVPVSTGLFQTALMLYESRPDKDWGLTDCTSFVVMKHGNLTEALSTDDHFRQAGFRALMLEQ